MTTDEMKGLKAGDLVRHKLHGRAMVVHINTGDAVVLVQTQVMHNSHEWNRVTHDGTIKAEGDE